MSAIDDISDLGDFSDLGDRADISDLGNISDLAAIDDSVDLPRPPERQGWRQMVPVGAAVLLDAVVIVLSALLAQWGRSQWGRFYDVDDSTGLAVVLVALWLVCLLASGAYSPHDFGGGSREYKNVMRATAFAAGLVGGACYLAKFPLSRSFFILLFAFGVTFLLISRYVSRKVLQAVRRRGHLQQSVLLVGAIDHVEEIASVLLRERWLGYSLIGALLPPGTTTRGETPLGLKVLGSTADTANMVRSLGVDAIIFAGGAVNSAREMRRATWELEDTKVRVLLAPSLTDVSSDRIHPRPAAGLPLIQLEGPGNLHASRFLKRVFDLVLSGLLLVMVAPVVGAIALGIKLGDRGPVFFVQQRVGRNGAPFGVLKFRSMVVDAEARLQALADLNRHGEEHVLFKAEHDPRITRIGGVLRRLSLDELPQLINVFLGHMSLVGPRPPLQAEVDRYEHDVLRRLVVRPGMTGLWQVSGRSNLSWEESVRLDLYYVDNWSLAQDLIILARTARAVVGGRGAY